jgi:hypothetical protein
MRNYFFVAAMLGVVGLAQAEDGAVEPVPATVASPARQMNPVLLTKVGDLPDALMDRLKAWAEESLVIPVPLGESLTSASDQMEAVVPVAAQLLQADDLGVVVLNAQATLDQPNGIYRPEARVVVINVTDMREGADEEKFALRLERQVIRGICVLMGLEWSPNPESAMTAYTSLEELDRMGRNLDPPWLLKFQERARELGLPLDPDSPMNFFRE